MIFVVAFHEHCKRVKRCGKKCWKINTNHNENNKRERKTRKKNNLLTFIQFHWAASGLRLSRLSSVVSCWQLQYPTVTVNCAHTHTMTVGITATITCEWQRRTSWAEQKHPSELSDKHWRHTYTLYS